MENDLLNTGPIERVIKQVKAAELAKEKDIKIPINEAKNLAYTLGIVMARLHGKLEIFIQSKQNTEETVKINLDGGNNW